MKIKHTIIALIPVVLLTIFASCKKTVPTVLDMYNVKLTIDQSKPFALDDDLEVEITSKDSVVIDYTLESPDADMYMVNLYKMGANAVAQKIIITDDGKRRVYSGSFTFKASDLGAGKTSYRIWPIDKNGVYLGDGYKRITINVLSDLKYYSNLKLFTADTTLKESPSFLSISDNKIYNYNEASAKSGSIDFGLYRKITIQPNLSEKEEIFIYTPGANPNPYPNYDVSAWTKKGTLFSAPVSKDISVSTWKTRFNTGPKIEAEAKLVNINLTSTTTAVDANQVVFFKTPDGKVGVLFIVQKYFDYLKRRYLWISYKMPDYQ